MPEWERFIRDRLALAGLRPERERRIVRELAANLEDVYQDALRDGASPGDAEQSAKGHIQDWERLAADLRSADPAGVEPRLDRLADRLLEAPAEDGGQRSRPWSGLARDVVHAARRAAAAPGFTAVAVLILAVGIGATALMFDVVDTLLFRPLPFPRAQEVVRIFEDADDGRPDSCLYPTFLELAAQRDVFAVAAASIAGGEATWLRPDGETRRVAVDFANSTYFPLVGVAPHRGRAFGPGEDVTGAPATAVVSHRFWTAAFGADPSLVGQVVRLSGAPVTIVGVGPRGFDGIVAGHAVDFWVSLSGLGAMMGEYAGGTLQRRDDHWFSILARLKPGVSLEEARAAVAVVAGRLAREFPEYTGDGRSRCSRPRRSGCSPGWTGPCTPLARR